MASAMVMHRYDLQYQLHTLALHCYLRHRIAEITVTTPFWRVIYLFLRGVGCRRSAVPVFLARARLRN